MTYKFDSQFIGYPPIEAVAPVPASPPFGLPISAGFLVRAEDPVWGPGEFVFARAGAGIKLYAGCTYLPVWDATNKVYTYNMTEWPITNDLGRPLYVYQGNAALTTGQYGWFLTTGRTPITGTGASIAADAKFSRGAAGVAVALAANTEVMGARVITPATNTVASFGRGTIGDNVIYLDNTSGFFVGGYVGGTGVGTAAIVSSVNPLGKYITVTVVNSAAIAGTVTQTANNATIFYNVIEANRMNAQGIIA